LRSGWSENIIAGKNLHNQFINKNLHVCSSLENIVVGNNLSINLLVKIYIRTVRSGNIIVRKNMHNQIIDKNLNGQLLIKNSISKFIYH
jgi:hypothetical protein